MTSTSKPIFTVALIVLLAIFAGCRREENREAPGTTAPAAGPSEEGEVLQAPPSSTNPDVLAATPREVIEDPSGYHGRVVTITGGVERVISPRVFTVESGLAGRGELLVLSDHPVPGVVEAGRARDLLADDEVIITGRVMNLVVPEVEREIGWDLDREIEIEFEKQPVMIIETMSASAATRNP